MIFKTSVLAAALALASSVAQATAIDFSTVFLGSEGGLFSGMISLDDSLFAPSTGKPVLSAQNYFLHAMTDSEPTIYFSPVTELYFGVMASKTLDFSQNLVGQDGFDAFYIFGDSNFGTNVGISSISPFEFTYESTGETYQLVQMLDTSYPPIPPEVPAVPLPASLPLLFAGLGAFGLLRRKREAIAA